jgi:hypothetical protein
MPTRGWLILVSLAEQLAHFLLQEAHLPHHDV